MRKSKSPIFNKAGIEITKANKRVRIPLAPLTRRSTLPTRTTRTTLNTVGEKISAVFKNFSKIIPI